MDNNAEPFDEGKNEGAEFGFKYDGEDDGFADDGRAMNYEDGGAGVENDDDDDDGSIFSDEDDLSDEEQDMDNEALPAFANAENRALNKDVEAQEKKKEVLTKGVIENADRVKIMKEHLKNVRQEVTHTQGLVEAKASECRSEDHLKALAERAVGGVRGRIQKYKIERDELQDRLNTVQNTIFKGNEKMDRFKLQMNWNQEELEQWALAAKQKEEDNLALQKYKRADEAKIKEITQQIQKATVAVSEAKANLENEVTETQSKQIELDKTAEEFRRLHRERQDLVRQWQESIEAMRRRDEDIRQAGEQYAEAKQVLADTKDRLRDAERAFEDIKRENAETEGRLKVKERKVQLIKLSYNGSGDGLQELKDEADVIKNQLAKQSADLAAKRQAINEQRQILNEKRAKLEAGRKRYLATKQRVRREEKEVKTQEEMAQKVEEELAEYEKLVSIVQKRVDKAKDAMFKQSQELFNHRQREANIIAEISGAQASAKNLNHKIHLLDQESLRQQELVYNAEFKIQEMERKVARAGGERSDEEKVELNKKIVIAQKGLDAVKEQQKMLLHQTKKVADELTRTRRKLKDANESYEKVQARVAELELVNEAAVQTLREHQKEREDIMVKHDVLKLEVKRLRSNLHSRADEVFGLANRKFQLQQSMEERKREIQVHRDVQRAACKAAEEERHAVAIEAKERISKVSVLRSKYESLVAAARPSDGGEEDKSQAYFIIKAAQKREELQREGDELDSNIRRAEREMKALENTLKHLNTRNTKFRISFQKADPSSREARETAQIELQLKTSKDVLFKKRKELQRLTTDFEEDSRRLRQVVRQTDQLSAHVQHLSDAHDQVSSELESQESALSTVSERVEHAALEHRRSKGVADEEETLEEKMFACEGLRESNDNVLYTLGQLAREFPEMRDTLNEALQNQGLNIPSRPPSRVSRGSSRQSNRGSSRGGGMREGL